MTIINLSQGMESMKSVLCFIDCSVSFKFFTPGKFSSAQLIIQCAQFFFRFVKNWISDFFEKNYEINNIKMYFIYLVVISQNLLKSLRIFQNLSKPFYIFTNIKFARCVNYQQDLNLLNFSENMLKLSFHHLKCIFCHQNMIKIFCKHHMYQFYVVCFEFFSF